jgi:hypothetical protein
VYREAAALADVPAEHDAVSHRGWRDMGLYAPFQCRFRRTRQGGANNGIACGTEPGSCPSDGLPQVCWPAMARDAHAIAA